MHLAKNPALNPELVNIIINNAIILLLTLFFQKNSISPNEYSCDTHNCETNLKSLFLNFLNDDLPISSTN
ncbi:hypothetical protein [Candidatus Harpocratesius sp.]